MNGDEVQFVRSATMELTGGKNRVKEILPNDKDTVKGAKEYRITFAEPLDAEITDKEGFGIETCPGVRKFILRIMSFVTTVHAVRCSALP